MLVTSFVLAARCRGCGAFLPALAVAVLGLSGEHDALTEERAFRPAEHLAQHWLLAGGEAAPRPRPANLAGPSLFACELPPRVRPVSRYAAGQTAKDRIKQACQEQQGPQLPMCRTGGCRFTPAGATPVVMRSAQ